MRMQAILVHLSIMIDKGAAARLLQKALDRRYEATIKRFSRAQNVDEVRGLWDDARRSGDIPGAYWALLTHPAMPQEPRQAAFADVHMLSHGEEIMFDDLGYADIRERVR
jgi:hypothetical protein